VASALLLGGFGLGVGVMIVLLAIGEAMLTQARRTTVGGGDVTVLPEGIDVEVMKTGGVGGMSSITNARFRSSTALESTQRTRRERCRTADRGQARVPSDARRSRARGPRNGRAASRSALVGAVPALGRAGGRMMTSTGGGAHRPPELRADIDHYLAAARRREPRQLG
jgi:hypothetical protein